MRFETEVAERLEKEQQIAAPQTETTEEVLGDAGTPQTSEQPEQSNALKLTEAVMELTLLSAAMGLINKLSILGREGVHSVARAILLLPVDGTTPESRAEFNAFIKSEAKRLVADALANGQEIPEGAFVAVTGN